VPVKGLKIEKMLRLVYRREQSLSHAAKSFLEIVRAHRNGLAKAGTIHKEG
jgi:hypothetical protein